jgi:hypothetical protein
MIFQNFGFNRQAIKVAAPSPGGGVVTSGLQAYYDAGNAGGISGTTLYDLSGNSRNATLTGDIAYSGSNGGVLDTGTTSAGYIACPSSVATALNAGTDATIMQWIKLDQSPPASDPQTGFIYMTNQSSGIGNHYPYTDGNIYTNVLKTARPSLGTPVSDLAVWHVMTISTSPGSNNWKMYINMTSQGTDTGDSTLALYNDLVNIGISGGGSDRLCGGLGPTLIYNQQLSTTDMQTNIDYFASRF